MYVNFLHFFISAKKESINLLFSLLAPIIQGAWKELLCRLCNLRTVLKTKPKMSNIHLFVWNSDFVEAKTQPDQSFEEMWKQHANERLVETKEERSERKIRQQKNIKEEEHGSSYIHISHGAWIQVRVLFWKILLIVHLEQLLPNLLLLLSNNLISQHCWLLYAIEDLGFHLPRAVPTLASNPVPDHSKVPENSLYRPAWDLLIVPHTAATWCPPLHRSQLDFSKLEQTFNMICFFSSSILRCSIF